MLIAQKAEEQRKPPAQQDSRPSNATARRNENVPLYQLDTNEQQDLNKRVGTTPSLNLDYPADRNAYSAEFGKVPKAGLTIRNISPAQRWHGSMGWNHQNSVLNARAFFQAGPVQPARRNVVSASAAGPAGFLGNLSFDFGSEKERGFVNGNVLVPLESERTPLTDDPEMRVVIQHYLDAYPKEAPNRTDFDPRALNTNAPQASDALNGTIRLDRKLNDSQTVFASYQSNRKRIDAFQLVAGQNPDTEIHSNLLRLSHQTSFSPEAILVAGFDFNRTRSVLKPEPNAVGPRVRVGYQIQDLGPDSEFPVDRALNQYTWSALASKQLAGGRHVLKFGGGLTRVQLNSSETIDSRGVYSFTNQFGRSAIENLLYGTPSRYAVSVGDFYRGFRNWKGQFFLGDDWQVSSAFRLGLGLRYEFEGTPVEVMQRDRLDYPCDCNNFSPRLSISYRIKDRSVLRASYSVSFGEIFPVTYQQVRNNPPLVRQLQVQDPDLLDPLQGIDLEAPGARYSPTLISPDLVAPYAHQYSLSWERLLGRGILIRLGYVGSRTIKPFFAGILNRAVIVPGIPRLPGTIDLRRPDQRYYEVYDIANGGIGYLDAAQVSLRIPSWEGLSLNASYTFSKAIDLGTDFTSTAANKDLTNGRDQSSTMAFEDRKGLSNFDSPHSFLVYYAYQLPSFGVASGVAHNLLNGWVISGTALAKRGTPLTFFVGSDAPGFGNVDGSTGDRPNLLDPSILGMTFGDPDTSEAILSRDRFGYILPGDARGNLGRNNFRKGPIRNVNLALGRTWEVDWLELKSILFRLEATNLTNTPQFDEPQHNVTSPSFGRITNTLNQGRVFQASLRLDF